MITNKKEYKEYLLADAKANNKKRKFPIPYIDIIWKQLRLLRRYEYHLNCYKNGPIKKIILLKDKLSYKKISIKTGIQLGPNCFGKGLTIYHFGSIIVNPSVKAGDNITIQSGVNIAENVIIGDNCYLAPGVKIAKNITINENCVIGYNSVVTHSLLETGTYVGIPAHKINNLGYVCDGKRRSL